MQFPAPYPIPAYRHFHNHCYGYKVIPRDSKQLLSVGIFGSVLFAGSPGRVSYSDRRIRSFTSVPSLDISAPASSGIITNPPRALTPVDDGERRNVRTINWLLLPTGSEAS